MKKNIFANLDGIEVKPCDITPDLNDKTKFVKLDNSSAAEIQISAFIQSAIPAMIANSTSQSLYCYFP
ncbi:MAG: hypothetical protein J1F28_08675 [Oscillospiraceae bacterium]|nr:hypothetical protein [Oscillospiraceae bacterium]